MAKKKKTSRKSCSTNKPNGHYCWVCGEHKAHEKFSGRGHATHMCKQCHALPVAERNQMVATRRAGNMAFRYLNEQDIKWLRKRMNDSRPEVRVAAREAHNIKFPGYERNMIKKGLTTRSLEFYIHGEVWDEYGDEIFVHMRFFADNTGAMRRIDYNALENEQETVINIGHSTALKFLKAVVHQLNAPFWSQDLSDARADECNPCDPHLDILPDFYEGYDEEDFDWALFVEDEDDSSDSEKKSPVNNKEPIWSLRLLLTKGMGEKVQTFYNQMHHEPQELFWSLMEWFEHDDEGEYNESGEDKGGNI